MSLTSLSSAVHSAVGPMDSDPLFARRIDRSGDCWTYIGSRDPQGYGKLLRDGKGLLAHRYAWTLAHGPIPAGLVVMHTCDNPPCVRLEHLVLGAQWANIQDRQRRGRHRPGRLLGEDHPAHKLTELDVVTIRQLAAQGASVRSLATRYGMSRTMILSIVQRKNWKHVA